MKSERKESILKYLSDLMTEPEKEAFEKEMDESAELKAEFEKISSMLNDFSDSKNIETEESYFVNLGPKVQQRLEKNKKTRFRWQPYIGFAMGILVLFFYADSFFQNPAADIFTFESERDSLENMLSSVDDDALSEYFAYDDISYYPVSDYDSEQSEIELTLIDDLGNVSTEALYQNEIKYYENFEVDKLEESEFEIIYAQLEKIKIL